MHNLKGQLVSSSLVSGIRWSPESGTDDDVFMDIAGGSHVGSVRSINEDNWMTCPPVFLVADGMGGHAGGDRASALVVESFRSLADESITPSDVDAAIQMCFESVNALGSGEVGAPGSTLVLVAYVEENDRGQWLLANIGDSRAYGLVDGNLHQLSHDHSVVQELVDAGEISEAEARAHPQRHVITRAIGALDDSAPDYTLLEVVRGTRLMLCSDGVSGELDDEQIGDILRDSATSIAAVDALIEAAVEAGGNDNITAVVIDIGGQRGPADAGTLENPATAGARPEDTLERRRRPGA